MKFQSLITFLKTQILSNRNLQVKETIILYGKWHFIYYAGSIAGGTFEPTYDYLEIVRFGIFGIIKNDSIKIFGRLLVNKQDSTETQISFLPETICLSDYQSIQRGVSFQGNDTLVLWDGMIDG